MEGLNGDYLTIRSINEMVNNIDIYNINDNKYIYFDIL